jgi:hypothetical protein
MIKSLLVISTLFICELLLAQKITVEPAKYIALDTEQNRMAIGHSVNSTQKATVGTYQLILSDQNHKFAVNDAFLTWIEENRKQTEDQYISINEYVKVFVPAVNTIQAEDFKPLQSVTVK